MIRWAVAALVLTGTGCLTPLGSLTQRSVLTVEGGVFELAWAPEDRLEIERTARAIERADQVLRRWGKFDQRVTLYLMPSHFLLEAAVRRYGYDWLRAWARYDDVYFQSPATWGGIGVNDAEVSELVLHELTHCLMYQRAGTRETWLHKQIPVWFREGMATWTANQGYKWPSLEDLARFYEQHPGADPIREPDPLYQRDSEAVYAAAHHGFTFLVRRYSEEAVHRLLDSMRSGLTFPQAFQAVTGISADAFAGEFRHYVVWRGFRAPGKPLRLLTGQPARPD